VCRVGAGACAELVRVRVGVTVEMRSKCRTTSTVPRQFVQR